MSELLTLKQTGFTEFLNDDEIGLLAAVINNLGQGDHPYIDSSTLDSTGFFYAQMCIDKFRVQVQDDLTDAGIAIWEKIVEKYDDWVRYAHWEIFFPTDGEYKHWEDVRVEVYNEDGDLVEQMTIPQYREFKLSKS